MIPRDSQEQRATIKRLRSTILTRPCPHYALPICHTRHRGDPCFRSLSGHAGYINVHIYIIIYITQVLRVSYTPWILVDLLRDDDNGGPCILVTSLRNKEKQRIILYRCLIIDP